MLSGTLGDYLKKAEDFLRKKEISNPRFEAQVIFSHFLNIKRFELFTNSEKPLEISEIDLLREKISLRAKGMPVAYITGFREFMGYRFRSDRRALIPRPETEELTELVLGLIGKTPKPLNICDMCCGSGVIGISIALKKENTKITLADISPEALELTRENISLFSLGADRVTVKQSDLFANFHVNSAGKFDVIVSNPPYILETEKDSVQKDVLEFEPHLALFVRQPTEFFTRLIAGAAEFLNPGGHFIAESSPSLVNPQLAILIAHNFKNVRSINDLSGKNRFIYGQIPD